ncbi:MAG: hypothetical protein HY394_04800 [Candidatus Diapherotrites archaeon]|nr:hypothetical protein [Candidatus Diapherotrites archaeon]
MAWNRGQAAMASFLLFALFMAGTAFADPQMKILGLKMTALDGPFAGTVLSDISNPSQGKALCPSGFAIGENTRVRIDETVQNIGSDPTANARIYFTWGSPGPLLLDCSKPNTRDIPNQRFCAAETKTYSFECTIVYSKYFAPSMNPKTIKAISYASFSGNNNGAVGANLCYNTTTQGAEYALIQKNMVVSSGGSVVAAGSPLNLGSNVSYTMSYKNNGNMPVCIKRTPSAYFDVETNAAFVEGHPSQFFSLQPDESKAFTENFVAKNPGTVRLYDMHLEYFEDCTTQLPVQNTVYYAGNQGFPVKSGPFAIIVAAHPTDNFWYVTGKPFTFNVKVKNTGDMDFTESFPLLVKLYFFKGGAMNAVRTKSVSLPKGQETTVQFVEPSTTDLFFTTSIVASAEFDSAKYDWPVRGPQMTGYLQNSFSKSAMALPIPKIISSNNSKEVFLTMARNAGQAVPLLLTNPSFDAQSFSLSASAPNLSISSANVSLAAATCGAYASDSSVSVNVKAPGKAGYYSYLVASKSDKDPSLADFLKINVKVLPDPCATQGGTICSAKQNCDGTPVQSSNAGLCCIGKCVANSGSISFSVAANSVVSRTIFSVFADYTQKISELLETDNTGQIVFERSAGGNVCVVQEKCTNGVDDDADGRIDCADSDCESNNACAGAKCDPDSKACVAGGTGASCITNASCEVDVTHLACQNSACIVAAGEGEDLCSRDADCTGKKQVCENNACTLVPGTGISECYSDTDCGPAPVGRCSADFSACQLAGEGQLCMQNSSCTSNSHSVCSNDACIRVIGEDGNQCDSGAECTGKHASCQGNACVLVDGSGEAECLSNPQCADPTEKHAVCSNNACVQVFGPGANQCSANNDCTDKHAACVNQACVLVDGAGPATCHSNDDCSSNTHSVCSNDSCQIGIGPGVNQCSADSQCVNKHAACDVVTKACVMVDGAGPATCVSDTDCGAPENAPDLFISDVKVTNVQFEDGKIISASVEFAVKNNGKPITSDFSNGLYTDRREFNPRVVTERKVSGNERTKLSDPNAEVRFEKITLTSDDFRNEITPEKKAKKAACVAQGGEWSNSECRPANENGGPGNATASGALNVGPTNTSGSGNRIVSGGGNGWGAGWGAGSQGDGGNDGGYGNGLGSIYGSEAVEVPGGQNDGTAHFSGVIQFQAAPEFEDSHILLITVDKDNQVAELNENNNSFERVIADNGEICGDGVDNNGNGQVDEGCAKKFGMCLSNNCVLPAPANWDGVSNFDTDGLSCSASVQCSEGSHTVCSNNACILAAGIGDDLCSSDSECEGKHAACQQNACVLVNGFGEAECLSNKDCGELPASEGLAVDLKNTVPVGEAQEITVFVKGQPAQDASISVVSPSSQSLSFTTAADGKARFIVKEEGEYSLVVKKDDLIARPKFSGIALLSSFVGTISDSAKIILGRATTEAPMLALLLLLLSIIDTVLAFVVFKRLFELKVVSRREENKRLLIRTLLALVFFVAPLAVNLVLGILFGIVAAILELGILFIVDNYLKKKGAIIRVKV